MTSNFPDDRSKKRSLATDFLFRTWLVVLVCLLAGCSGKGNVTGTVTFQGEPLVFGTVMFEASDGSLRQGNIDAQGHYTITEVTPGTAKVSVSSRNPASSDFQLLRLEGEPPPPPREVPAGWFPIPGKYETPATSGLEFSVQGGANTIDIELK
ncbi:MAG: carboxypeptidase-like regulatory domain-containing protein [Gemmataceae bacterium]